MEAVFSNLALCTLGALFLYIQLYRLTSCVPACFMMLVEDE